MLNEALQGVGAKCDIENIFEELSAAYDGDERHYHDWAHIESCLELLEEHGSKAESRHEVELAIRFHDEIYDPRKNSDGSGGAARMQCDGGCIVR